MTPLLVFPDKYTRGVDGFDAEGEPFNRSGKPLVGGTLFEDGLQALLERYDTDAHCAAYSCPGVDGVHPRINKRALPDLIARGAEPLLRWAIVDVDNPDHAPWEEPVERAFFELKSKLAADPLTASAGVYLSSNGYRLLWPLEEPVPVSEAEGYLRGLLLELRRRGVEADLKVADWPRVFRLPRVRREGVDIDLPLEL